MILFKVAGQVSTKSIDNFVLSHPSVLHHVHCSRDCSIQGVRHRKRFENTPEAPLRFSFRIALFSDSEICMVAINRTLFIVMVVSFPAVCVVVWKELHNSMKTWGRLSTGLLSTPNFSQTSQFQVLSTVWHCAVRGAEKSSS